jgi:hypothetical protein
MLPLNGSIPNRALQGGNTSAVQANPFRGKQHRGLCFMCKIMGHYARDYSYKYVNDGNKSQAYPDVVSVTSIPNGSLMYLVILLNHRSMS